MSKMSSDSELEFTNKNKSSNKKNAAHKTSKKKSKSKPKGTVATSNGDADASSSSNINNPDIVINDGAAVGGCEESAIEVIVSSSSSSCEDTDSDKEGGTYGYGKQALGIDPSEISNYDGKSQPINGSQYLLSVMNEKRITPKIAVADADSLNSKTMHMDSGVTYLDKFDKEVNFQGANVETQEKYNIPSQTFRDNNLQDFSLLRSKVERWRELLANGVTRLKTEDIKLPEAGNKVVWQKFCFGLRFEELLNSRQAIGKSSLTINKIMSDYFADLRGGSENESIIKCKKETAENEGSLSAASITTTSHTISSVVSSNPSDSDSIVIVNQGYQPLMSVMLILSQHQIECLIFFHSEWISKHGFINKCQGEWLYALLACIDKPVDPSTMGDIRNICKSLITIRNMTSLVLKRNGVLPCDDDEIDKLSDDFQKDVTLDENLEDVSTQAEDYLSALNLFIFLISDYFCQKDLIGHEL